MIIERFEREKRNKLIGEVYQRLERNLERDFKEAVKIPAVRRIIHKLLSETGLWRSTFSESAAKAAFLEGQRDIGLHLLKWFMDWSPENYTKMLKEHSDEFNQIKLELERLQNGNRSDNGND